MMDAMTLQGRLVSSLTELEFNAVAQMFAKVTTNRPFFDLIEAHWSDGKNFFVMSLDEEDIVDFSRIVWRPIPIEDELFKPIVDWECQKNDICFFYFVFFWDFCTVGMASTVRLVSAPLGGITVDGFPSSQGTDLRAGLSGGA